VYARWMTNIDDPAHAEVQRNDDGHLAVSLVFPCPQETALPRPSIALSSEQARTLAQGLVNAAFIVELERKSVTREP
jgi:hypothetical protein